MTELEELGRTLKTARRKKNLTQQQLADLSHMSLKYLQLVEKGRKNPSFEILRALSGVLDLSLDALINPTMENDEKAANEMKQLYLSCPPDVRVCFKTIKVTKAKCKREKQPHESRRLFSHTA